MIPKQAFIHTLYWTGTYILLSVGYCFIGVLDQGFTYAAFSLPLILGATYFFLRVHRSYLVNPDYCRAFNGKSVLIDDHEIPIGRTYKNEIRRP